MGSEMCIRDRDYREGLVMSDYSSAIKSDIDYIAEYILQSKDALLIKFTELEEAVKLFIRFLESAKNIKCQLIKAPITYYNKALNVLARAKEACKNRNSDALEDNVILFLMYLRSAIDSMCYGLAIWFLERLKRWPNIFLAPLTDKKRLAKLLYKLNYDTLLKFAVLVGDEEAYKKFEDFMKKVHKLDSEPCWRLRNALAHGYPYFVIIEGCRICSLGTEKEVSLGLNTRVGGVEIPHLRP